MKRKPAKTADQKRSDYLVRKYGITSDTYNEQLALQGGGCAICGRKARSRSLHCDHSHALRYHKVWTAKLGPKQWVAKISIYPEMQWNAETKPAVLALARQFLKVRANRGLLCYPCNGGLRKWYDNAANMRSAADYLDRYDALNPKPVKKPVKPKDVE